MYTSKIQQRLRRLPARSEKFSKALKTLATTCSPVKKFPGAIPLGIASGLLNLLPFLGLMFSPALPRAAAILQFNTPGPYIVITLTILFLHVVSANLLIPKFIANRVSIGPVAATVGILFWGWLWGGLTARCTAHRIHQAGRGFASVLMSLVEHAGADATSDSALGSLRRNGFGTDNPLLAPPSGKSSRGAPTLGDRGAHCI